MSLTPKRSSYLVYKYKINKASILEGKREVINLINWGIYDVMETPVDILVYGPEEFQERANRNVTMEYKIALGGQVLYEKY